MRGVVETEFQKRGPDSMGSEAWAAERIRQHRESGKSFPTVAAYAAQLAFKWGLLGDDLGLSADEQAEFDQLLATLIQEREANRARDAAQKAALAQERAEWEVKVERIKSLVNETCAAMSTSWVGERAARSAAVNDLREAIREYVEQHHEDFADDVEDWILPKVRDLDSPSRIGAEAVILDEDFEPDFLAHLCGCSNWDEEMEERSDADCIDSIHGYIEQIMSDTADLEAQVEHMRSNASGGLKRHIDNLISDLPQRKARASQRQSCYALDDEEDDDDAHY